MRIGQVIAATSCLRCCSSIGPRPSARTIGGFPSSI
ncbi:hypothetical protein M3J09_011254 [Ascochyta lentis]